jgi:hypothetical protein
VSKETALEPQPLLNGKKHKTILPVFINATNSSIGAKAAVSIPVIFPSITFTAGDVLAKQTSGIHIG